MITDHFKSRGYQILAARPESPNFWMGIDASAQFRYKDFMISMSTMGRSQGACMTAVCVMCGDDFSEVKQDGFHTVEDAIRWIDQNAEVGDTFLTISSRQADYSQPYALAFQKYLADKKVDSTIFEEVLDGYLKERPIMSREKVIAMLRKSDMGVEDFRLAMNIFNML